MGGDVPLQESDIIFSSASNSLNIVSKELKRSSLSITNRLHSIKADADFVQQVATQLQLPLIGNERCGSWYIPPSQKVGSAYFKSTDGHHGQWSFSLRRLNFHLLDIIGRYGGCIIVDSTRRGKSMPDALSKTVPIWVAVLNRAIFPNHPGSHALLTPEGVVGRSEHAQMSDRIDEFVRQLAKLSLNVVALRVQLGRPMAPFWVTPDTDIDEIVVAKPGCHPIVLCTASSRSSLSADRNQSNYVQGAADDSESWSHGLNAEAFWQNSEELLSTAEADLPSLMTTLMTSKQPDTMMQRPVLLLPTSWLWVCDSTSAEQYHQDFDVIISASKSPSETLAASTKRRYLHLACDAGKVGSRKLRSELNKLGQLPNLVDLVADPKILVTCPTGHDLAIGVALAVLCRFGTENGESTLGNSASIAKWGEVESESANFFLSKEEIRRRLSWILLALPEARPSRATLQSVNAFILG